MEDLGKGRQKGDRNRGRMTRREDSSLAGHTLSQERVWYFRPYKLVYRHNFSFFLMKKHLARSKHLHLASCNLEVKGLLYQRYEL